MSILGSGFIGQGSRGSDGPHRRPGYDEILSLLKDYNRLSDAQREQLNERELSESYVEPMFQALGWEVWTGGGTAESKATSLDLQLEYTGLRVPVEVKRPGLLDARVELQRQWLGGWDWGILTDFETVRIWDLRDPNQPRTYLESGPRSYVTDEDEQHDLLAAEVFYERLGHPGSAPSITGNRFPVTASLVERVEQEALSPLDALNQARSLADPASRARSLVSLYPYLADEPRAELPFQVLAIMPKIESGSERATILSTLASHLPADDREDLLQGAMVAARQISDAEARSEALIAIAEQLPNTERASVVEEALAAARAAGDTQAQSELLQKIAEVLPADQREEVLTEAERTGATGREPGERPSEERERLRIATRGLADKPSKEDLLRFSDYADALADFIRDENTEKPLTIAIDAAWGMGKTSLMLMIKDRLAKRVGNVRNKRAFPTVWFNAWKYDQEESLWAALALEILDQVRDQHSWWEQMRFWWNLNRRRIDKGLVRRSILKLLGTAIGVVVLLTIGVIWLGTEPFRKYAASVGILGVLAALYSIGRDVSDHVVGPFDLKLAEYVRRPNYRERIGFLVEFEEDFKRVIDSVTDDGKWPLVVFIDDLDRCAPPKPAEIIEAINILLDAKHCVFIIGMDAESVAASIEARYEDLCSHLERTGDPGGLTLGQRFLEKIVQIRFRVPRADRWVFKSFIDANLDKSSRRPSKPSEQEVEEAAQLIEAEQRAGKRLEEAVQEVHRSRSDIPQTVLKEAKQERFAKTFSDSEVVREAIHEAAPYLDFNPRKTKRFINMFRLQALIANRRGLLWSGVIQLDLLAKWIVIVTRWPAFAEAASSDESLVNLLIEAHDLKKSLEDTRSVQPVSQQDREAAQNQLDQLSMDTRIERWIDAADLIELLKSVVAQTDFDINNYGQLVRTTPDGPVGPQDTRSS